MSCSNSIIGTLLHRYELGMVNEEEADRFEKHLLECDECFTEYNSMASYSSLMREDKETRDVILGLAKSAHSADRFKKLRESLWPDAPIWFKPAIAYALVVLLLPFALIGLRQGDTGTPNVISSPEFIQLNSMRGISPITEANGSKDNIFAWEMPTLDSTGESSISVIKLPNLGVVYKMETPLTITDGLGTLFVPANTLVAGYYGVVVQTDTLFFNIVY